MPHGTMMTISSSMQENIKNLHEGITTVNGPLLAGYRQRDTELCESYTAIHARRRL